MGVFAFLRITSKEIAFATADKAFYLEVNMSAIYLSKAIEGFLLSKSASGRSPNTIRNYRQELSRFIERNGDMPIDSISKSQIEKHLQYLKEGFKINIQGNTSTIPRNLSSKSVRNAWGTLSVFWKWVSKEFEISNPFDIPHIKAYTKPINPLSQEEIESILRVCDNHSKFQKNGNSYSSRRPTAIRDRAIILTLLDSGIRVSELIGIKIKDIDFELGRILVTGKGNKQRYIYLGKISRQAIWRYVTERFPIENPPILDKLVSTISKFIELIALLSPIYQSLSEKNITTSDSKIYYPAGTS